MPSLWGEEFEISSERSKAEKLMKRLSGKTDEQLLHSRLTPLKRKLEIIAKDVYAKLGHYKDLILVLKSRAEFHDYISIAIAYGMVAIDTETNYSPDRKADAINPFKSKIMGLCIYTPGSAKTAYVPINHIDINTGERFPWECNEQDVHEELQRIVDSGIKVLMHNYQFDFKLLKLTCDVDMPLYWDTYCAAKMIDENEVAGLKSQYISKVAPDQDKYTIQEFFSEVAYETVDPDLFAYYSATDAYMTYKLYEWQLERFKDPAIAGNYRLLREIELPLEPILARMTLRGISLDRTYIERLQKKYHKLQEESEQRINAEIAKYSDAISKWRLTPEAVYKKPKKDGTFEKSKSDQLDQNINTKSTLQLQILLYDVLKVPSVDKNSPRGTGEDVLEKLYAATGLVLCKLILEKRKLDKLVGSFIDTIPENTYERDGRVHPSFNNVGTATGRLSSDNPNFQNIPARNNEVRTMMCAQQGGGVEIRVKDFIEVDGYDEVETTQGWLKVKNLNAAMLIYSADRMHLIAIKEIKWQKNYVNYRLLLKNIDDNAEYSIKVRKARKVLVGSDYSQLEVKTAVHTCKDPVGIQAYKDGKDFYSMVASMSFGKPYEECLEFYPEGYMLETPNGVHECKKHEITNYEGKTLRQFSKSILIGSLYGRGASSVAEQINETIENPKEKKSTAEVQKMMDDFYAGFPVMSKWMEDSKKYVREHGCIYTAVGRRRLLPDGTLPDYTINVAKNVKNTVFNPFLNCEDRINPTIINEYKARLDACRSNKERSEIIEEAKLKGVSITNNRGFIAQAERQAVNTQCQSLGADIVKRLLCVIDEDVKLKELGFTLLLQIHDEIIGECPTETQDEVIDRVNEIMSKVPEDMGILVPFTTDAYAVSNWYIDEIESSLSKSFRKMKDAGEDAVSIINKLSDTHTELTHNAIERYLLYEEPLTTN